MEPLPKRKPNRLTGYDYSQPGCYFVTICAKNREPLFWTNRENKTEAPVGAACGRPSINIPGAIPKTSTDVLPLSPMGVVVHGALKRLSHRYPMVSADKFVVMPNHVHLLLRIDPGENGRPQAAPTLMQVINQFKGSVTRQIGQPIWQKGYHDHIIRGEADYVRIWDYIDTNPARWREDCYCCEERWTAVDHTYLFRPWGWTAEGTYYDGEGRAFPLTGWARVAREPGRWALEGALEVRGDEPLRITNRYRLEETGSPLVLAWESHNPALGVLRGTFELAGDSIFSRYRSQDGAYEGQEVLTMRSEGLYYNAGIALHGGRRLSAWTALLTAESRDGGRPQAAPTGTGALW